MCYLACLAIGALILIDRAVDNWTGGLSREVTVQVRKVKDTDIEAEVAERRLVAAVEVHLEAAVGEPGARLDVGVPVTDVETARMSVIDPTLYGRLTKSLVDTTETVAGEQADVGGQRRCFRSFRRCLRHGRCHECRCQKRRKQDFLHG